MKYSWYFLKIVIQCTWGVGQTLIGLICFLVNFRRPHYLYRGCVVTRWGQNSGVSLGLFIFIPDEKLSGSEDYSARLLVHEYGHTFQSLMLGPFMLIPGIVSICWFRMEKNKRLRREKGVSYCACWTESWANRLGERATGEKSIE